MQFHRRNFGQRFAVLGDTAENVYESVKPLGNTTRFGWRRPKGVRMQTMHINIRHMPDFYAEAGYFVEVMGCGRDNILKSMKVSKWEALKFWQATARKSNCELALFVWNSNAKQWVLLSYDSLKKLVAKAKKVHGVQAFENDGNEYYPIDWDWLVEEAEQHGEYHED